MKKHHFKKLIIIVAIWIFFSRIYYLIRFGGYWSEWDTGYMAMALRSFGASADLVPSSFVYVNGFGFQLFMSSLLQITGISVKEAQTIFSVFLGILPFIVAYPLYRKVTGDREVALFALFLLSLFTYFLIINRDGTHDKYTNTLILLYFFCLYNIYFPKENRHIVPFVLISLVSIGAIAAYNLFIATSFSIILLLSFFLSFTSQTLFRKKVPMDFQFSMKRQVRNFLMGFVAIFVSILWVYPPAISYIYYTKAIAEGFNALVFHGAPVSETLAYDYVFATYPNIYVYLTLSFYQWSMIVFSIFGWLFLFLTINRVDDKEKKEKIWIWLMIFAAFSLLSLFALITDLSGGTHYQMRVFANLVMFLPLVVALVVFHDRFLKTPFPKMKRLAVISMTLIIVVGVPTCLLYSTGDPMISNDWSFYNVQEEWALKWSENQFSNNRLAAGLDERLIAAYYINANLETFWNVKFGSYFSSGFFLVSSIIEKRIDQTGVKLPIDVINSSRIYTSGDVQIYKK